MNSHIRINIMVLAYTAHSHPHIFYVASEMASYSEPLDKEGTIFLRFIFFGLTPLSSKNNLKLHNLVL